MSKKIMLFSRDPGGANTVAPLYKELMKKGYVVDLYGKDAALNRYNQYGLKGIDITSKLNNISQEEIHRFLSKESPDFLITGTSADDFTEKYLWNQSSKLNIKSFAILDHWVNYGVRFSEFDLSRLEEYDMNKRHPYLPYKILVMDDYAKNQMINEGIKQEKILVSGQPYFDYLIEKQENTNMKDIVSLKNSLFENKNALLITFVSEPISKIYNESDQSEHYLGYTERTIFKQFYRILNKIAINYKTNINLVIRLHPKEDKNNYNDITQDINSKYISFLIDNKTDGFSLMCASDLICGMTSMFLIESTVVGKPILSMQMGLKRENSFILNKQGIAKSILAEDELEEKLKEILFCKKIEKCSFKIEKGAVKKVIEYMEGILCQC